eukprot:6028561-Prymnesium_polylepis.1
MVASSSASSRSSLHWRWRRLARTHHNLMVPLKPLRPRPSHTSPAVSTRLQPSPAVSSRLQPSQASPAGVVAGFRK